MRPEGLRRVFAEGLVLLHPGKRLLREGLGLVVLAPLQFHPGELVVEVVVPAPVLAVADERLEGGVGFGHVERLLQLKDGRDVDPRGPFGLAQVIGGSRFEDRELLLDKLQQEAVLTLLSDISR